MKRIAFLCLALAVGLPQPSGAHDTHSAASLERRWLALETECRGGPHSQTDAVCHRRDVAEAALEARGLCWAYSDVRVYPQDYRWHRCSEARPKGWRPD